MQKKATERNFKIFIFNNLHHKVTKMIRISDAFMCKWSWMMYNRLEVLKICGFKNVKKHLLDAQ